MTITQLLSQAKIKLAEVVDQPQLDAEILLAHALKVNRGYLFAHAEEEVKLELVELFLSYVARRANKEPIAYIRGKQEFWSLDFIVNSATLIPRPETELLVETVLELFSQNKKITLSDLGTGSGAIALSLAHECPGWQIVASDSSHAALEIAQQNAERFELKNVVFLLSDWCDALPTDFDVIVSNPPYIAESEWPEYQSGLAFEPRTALLSGKDGLDDIRTISHSAKKHLKSSGFLVIEHGFSQGPAVRSIFAAEGYQAIKSIRDLSGQERVTLGQIP